MCREGIIRDPNIIFKFCYLQRMLKNPSINDSATNALKSGKSGTFTVAPLHFNKICNM